MPVDKWTLFVKITTSVVLLLFAVRIVIVIQDDISPPRRPKAGNYFHRSNPKPIALRLSPTTHYKLDGANSSLSEFAALLPKGGHTVHIDNPDLGVPEVHTVTLFHQLKCLDIIQSEYVDKQRPAVQPLSSLTRHCLNYLKQMFLCRPSMGIEWIVNPYAHAVRSYEMVCRDWTAVYAEAERNQRAYGAAGSANRR